MCFTFATYPNTNLNSTTNLNNITRHSFAVLDTDARQLVLREPLNEIVRMLEQNLLTKFRRLVALQKGESTSFIHDIHTYVDTNSGLLSRKKRFVPSTPKSGKS